MEPRTNRVRLSLRRDHRANGAWHARRFGRDDVAALGPTTSETGADAVSVPRTLGGLYVFVPE